MAAIVIIPGDVLLTQIFYKVHCFIQKIFYFQKTSLFSAQQLFLKGWGVWSLLDNYITTVCDVIKQALQYSMDLIQANNWGHERGAKFDTLGI